MMTTTYTPAPLMLPAPTQPKKRLSLPKPTLIRHYADIMKVTRPINLVVFHCSATQEDRTYTPKQLIRDHLRRGFLHAGYHFYITRGGDLYALRPLSVIGAHVAGHNEKSIGVCYEGGLDRDGLPADTRTTAQKIMMEQLMLRLRELWPDIDVCGHRDLSPDVNGDGVITKSEWTKMCPCFDARKL